MHFVSRETERCIGVGLFGVVGILLGNFGCQGYPRLPTSLKEASFMEGV